jgi:predicted ATPase
MKIGVTGCQNSGKTTFIKDFLKAWPNYTTPKKTYRDLVKKKNLKVNKQGTKDAQMAILNYHIDDVQKFGKEDNVIFDRCVIDPLAYSLWLHEKGLGDVSDEDIHLMLKLVKESLKLYDIIFWIPLTKAAPIPMAADDNNLRDLDETYRDEVNNIFNAINKDYVKRTGTIFPLEDCPALIEIFGSPEERITMAKFYVNPEGEPFGEESSLIADALQDGTITELGNKYE